MTLEELRAEAKKLGYRLQADHHQFCKCVVGREYQLAKGRPYQRRKCESCTFYKVTKHGYTYCIKPEYLHEFISEQ